MDEQIDAGNRQQILIVEDSDDDFEATSRALKRSNLCNPVVRAIDGQQALQVLATNPRPGLVLLDLNMPGMGGARVLEAIKSSDELRRVPVVVLTTSNDPRDIDRCYALGANSYVQKPVDLDGLFAAMRRLKEYWIEVTILPAA